MARRLFPEVGEGRRAVCFERDNEPTWLYINEIENGEVNRRKPYCPSYAD